jgi:hypothetical protein
VSAPWDRAEAQRRIIAVVSRETRCREEDIGPDTDLVFDLGVAGDDADDLFREITKLYPIDFSGSDLPERFGSEGVWPWQPPLLLLRMLKSIFTRIIVGQAPQDRTGGVRIRDITDWVMSGKWTPPR